MLQNTFCQNYTLISHRKPIALYVSFRCIFHIQSKDKQLMNNKDANKHLPYWRSKSNSPLALHDPSESEENRSGYQNSIDKKSCGSTWWVIITPLFQQLQLYGRSLPKTKLLINSVISDAHQGVHFLGIDIKDFFLLSYLPPDQKEYIRIHSKYFDEDFRKLYNITPIIGEGG